MKVLAKEGMATAVNAYNACAERGQDTWAKAEPSLAKAFSEVQVSARTLALAGLHGAKDGVDGIVDRIRYSPGELDCLQKHIRYQGAYYRELNRKSAATDAILLGGESIAHLAASADIPDHIVKAYEAAYPQVSKLTSLQAQLRDLEGDELQGLVSGVKGKLFEHQYVEFLNDGNLPDGYRALLAESVTQPGWDLRIEGGNGEVVEVLQAKATESTGYVMEALRKHPEIDVVTTDEVYGHLVMGGVSEGIINSGISDESLEQALDGAASSAGVEMSFSPPWFTLALIAFTTYKDESLSLYQKARTSGDRAGKAYLCYLLGGTLAAVTNTWWLGMVGTVVSRYTIAEGKRRRAIFDKARAVARANDKILGRLEALLREPKEQRL
jgi:hypothetical protein